MECARWQGCSDVAAGLMRASAKAEGSVRDRSAKGAAKGTGVCGERSLNCRGRSAWLGGGARRGQAVVGAVRVEQEGRWKRDIERGLGRRMGTAVGLPGDVGRREEACGDRVVIGAGRMRSGFWEGGWGNGARELLMGGRVREVCR